MRRGKKASQKKTEQRKGDSTTCKFGRKLVYTPLTKAKGEDMLGLHEARGAKGGDHVLGKGRVFTFRAGTEGYYEAHGWRRKIWGKKEGELFFFWPRGETILLGKHG